VTLLLRLASPRWRARLLALLQSRAVGVISHPLVAWILLAFVMGMLNFVSIVLFPTLFHDLRGYPDNAIAWLIAARGVGNWTAFLFIAQLTRVAPRFAIVCGMALQAGAGFWMTAAAATGLHAKPCARSGNTIATQHLPPAPWILSELCKRIARKVPSP
jgi:cytochrome c oxidase assembly factor CtaG